MTFIFIQLITNIYFLSRKDRFLQRDDKSNEGDSLRTSGFEWNTVLDVFSYKSYKK